MDIPTLETDRLILRGLTDADLDAYAGMMADPEVVRYIGGETMDRADAWRNMATVAGHWQLRGFGFFALEEKASGDFVGRVGPWMPEGWPALECGWTLAKPAWGKGYASEAARRAIAWIFEQKPDLTRIISVIHEDNVNSQGVARRIGETKTDEIFTYKGGRYPIWAMSRETFFAT